MHSEPADPYLASKKYDPHGAWYDSFARGGQIAWLVFYGSELLARVENQQQAVNLVCHMGKHSTKKS